MSNFKRFVSTTTSQVVGQKKPSFQQVRINNIPLFINNGQINHMLENYGPFKEMVRLRHMDTGFPMNTIQVFMTLDGVKQLEKDSSKSLFWGRTLSVRLVNRKQFKPEWIDTLDNFVELSTKIK